MMTRYTNTRAQGTQTDLPQFAEVVVKGIAETGGLFVPVDIPHLTMDEILSFSEMPYHERAAYTYKRFGVDFCDEHIDALMRASYGDNFDTPAVAPVEEVLPGTHVLELWHGPTHAFKDMALQCMPQFFSAAIDKMREQGQATEDYLILVATSGDTGKAALEGFADRDHVSIAVFYPADGVSDIQRKQMVTQHGDNVSVFGVRGNFDDCQNAVKAVFGDPEFNRELALNHNIKLSSANSINWGRLMPQIVYYMSAYAEMVANGGVTAGDHIDVCVPTGNFGDILAGYYAKRMGVPIANLICASNENRVLTDFINTGTYDIRGREFHVTVSPSMDILISSNLERLLFELTCHDGERIAGWMRDLRETGRFQIDEATFARLREDFIADCADSDKALETIRRVYDENEYLLDPHTAVAWEVGERLRTDRPLLVVSTAHWAKFGQDVLRALTGTAAGAPLPREFDGLTGAQLNDEVVTRAPHGSAIPMNLVGIDDRVVRFDRTIDAGHDQLIAVIDRWLDDEQDAQAQ